MGARLLLVCWSSADGADENETAVGTRWEGVLLGSGMVCDVGIVEGSDIKIKTLETTR
jgi:hypothetical protein